MPNKKQKEKEQRALAADRLRQEQELTAQEQMQMEQQIPQEQQPIPAEQDMQDPYGEAIQDPQQDIAMQEQARAELQEAPEQELMDEQPTMRSEAENQQQDILTNGVPFKQAEQDTNIGRSGVIGEEQIGEADTILKKYKEAKKSLDARIIENEKWYKLRHWDEIGSRNPDDPEPTSAWLLNSIANKHADAMDNYPEPIVLPREQSDEDNAKVLTDVLPVVLEQNEFEDVYSQLWWNKLKVGTGVFGVYWNKNKLNGLGDIDIQAVDLLELYWEPAVTDIQASRNVFHEKLVDRDMLEERYPDLEGQLASAASSDTKEYAHDDQIDTTDKAVVVDWYYKVHIEGREVLHYCKYCSGHVLYASENDPEYAERGFYDHGEYPFVFDVLFPEADTPVGFGYIDMCKSPQIYIDKLDQVILKHAVMGSRPRFFIRNDGSINEQEFADWTKEFVHYNGSGSPHENITPIEVPTLSSIYVQVRDNKVEELKETSGNRDFSQGGTAAGVTAASAIAALQEAGSKLSRDMIKSAYRKFRQTMHLCIELMRQFYAEERYFRITGDMGQNEYQSVSADMIGGQQQGNDFGLDIGSRLPIFDVTVVSQKASPFSTVAQNERAKELYGMGFFQPEMAEQALAALEMMSFEGIEQVRSKISENANLQAKLMALQEQQMKLAQIVDLQNGTTIMDEVAGGAGAGMQGAQPPPIDASVGREDRTNNMGEVLKQHGQGGQAGNARLRAAQAASPQR